MAKVQILFEKEEVSEQNNIFIRWHNIPNIGKHFFKIEEQNFNRSFFLFVFLEKVFKFALTML